MNITSRAAQANQPHKVMGFHCSDAGCIVGTFVIAPILLIAAVIWCCYYCKKSNELKAKQANATTPLLADPQTFPVVVPVGAGPGSKIRVKNPQTGADVNVIVPAGITAGMQFLVPLKPAADENI